jgi:hypothetical protein
MANKLAAQRVSAELASVEALLAALPGEDILGRIGLESKKRNLSAELVGLTQPENLASVALMFGGRPVVGSIGIESSFAADVVSHFQQLVTNVWATEAGEIGARGPVERQEESTLHITSLLHGSVGFLLEEVESQNRLSPSPLKRASELAAKIVEAFTTDSDDIFRAVLEDVDNRVLIATRNFLKELHNSNATLRLIEGNLDLSLDFPTVERAHERAESAEIQDTEEEATGELLGLIPYGRKFEVRLSDGALISGSVAPTLSETYLRRLEEEQLVGRQCTIKIRRKRITRFGRVTESVILLDIEPGTRG